MKCFIKKIDGCYVLYKNDEIVEVYDTRPEAELASFDLTRRWESLYDYERQNDDESF